MTKSTIDENEARPVADTKPIQPKPQPEPKAEAPQKPQQPSRTDEKEVPPLPRKRVFVFAVLLVAGLLGYGGFKHWQTDQRAQQAQQEVIDFVPEVTTITAQADGSPTKLTLPGQTEAFNIATIYPRATGYVAERRVDIGSRVKQGDLLLRIAAPDLDQQLAQSKAQLLQAKAGEAQAQASLDTAKANLALANVTFARTNAMAERGYETVQNNDNRRTQVQAQQAQVETAEAGIKVADANTKAAQASVDRLTTLTEFERVMAPFDGVVTTRSVEVGDLVNADNKTGTPLFTVVHDEVLRVTVHVPQVNAFAIHDGLVGSAYLPEKPEKSFTGRVARSSVSLVNSARVLNTQVDVDNPKGELKPGAYVNVSFDIPRDHPKVVLPAETIIFNEHGLQVAVVDDDHVRLQTISIYRDFGKTFEVRDGVNGGEQVIFNPPPDLTDHQKVKVKPKPPEKQAKT